jgi:hypothetical protein
MAAAPAAGDGSATVDDDDDDADDENALVLPSFRCPVMLTPMTDPQTISCGHTFDVATVQALTHHKAQFSCPTCRAEFTIAHRRVAVRNHALRSAMEEAAPRLRTARLRAQVMEAQYGACMTAIDTAISAAGTPPTELSVDVDGQIRPSATRLRTEQALLSLVYKLCTMDAVGGQVELIFMMGKVATWWLASLRSATQRLSQQGLAPVVAMTTMRDWWRTQAHFFHLTHQCFDAEHDPVADSLPNTVFRGWLEQNGSDAVTNDLLTRLVVYISMRMQRDPYTASSALNRTLADVRYHLNLTQQRHLIRCYTKCLSARLSRIFLHAVSLSAERAMWASLVRRGTAGTMAEHCAPQLLQDVEASQNRMRAGTVKQALNNDTVQSMTVTLFHLSKSSRFVWGDDVSAATASSFPDSLPQALAQACQRYDHLVTASEPSSSGRLVWQWALGCAELDVRCGTPTVTCNVTVTTLQMLILLALDHATPLRARALMRAVGRPPLRTFHLHLSSLCITGLVVKRPAERSLHPDDELEINSLYRGPLVLDTRTRMPMHRTTPRAQPAGDVNAGVDVVLRHIGRKASMSHVVYQFLKARRVATVTQLREHMQRVQESRPEAVPATITTDLVRALADEYVRHEYFSVQAATGDGSETVYQFVH